LSEVSLLRMPLRQGKYGVRFASGFNPRVRFLCMTLEPIRFSHRLLLFYVVLRAVQFIAGEGSSPQ
jgi:hypothetical protein